MYIGKSEEFRRSKMSVEPIAVPCEPYRRGNGGRAFSRVLRQYTYDTRVLVYTTRQDENRTKTAYAYTADTRRVLLLSLLLLMLPLLLRLQLLLFHTAM